MGWFQNMSDKVLRHFVIDADGVLVRYKGKGKHVVIPDKVKAIGEGAFAKQDQLESVTIPENVRIIMERAFQKCARLAEVTLSEGLVSIGARAFEYCSVLEEIKIPLGCHTIDKRAFLSCSSLQKAELPGGLCNIGEQAFAKCTELTEMVLPSSVVDLGAEAFLGCSALRTVTLPKHLPLLRNGSFMDCTSLETIVIPAKMRSIGAGAFYGCTALRSVTLPEQLMLIEEGAFQKCTSLREITLPDRILTLSAEIFSECSSLERIEFRKGLVHIGQSAFFGCTALQEITLPERLESIGDDAFRDCTALHSVRIPESVCRFGERCFLQTPWLETYPEEMLVQGNGVLLKYLGNARTLEIPASVKTIHEQAFARDTAPHTLVLSETAEHLEWEYIPGLELILRRKGYSVSLKMYDRYSAFGRDEKRVLQFWECKNAVRRHLLFFEIRDPVYKFPLAVLMYLSEPEDEFYAGYVERNAKDILKNLIVRNDLENLEKFMECGFITEKNVDELIEYAINHAQKTGNMEPQLALMDYKGKKIGYTDIADIFGTAFDL